MSTDPPLAISTPRLRTSVEPLEFGEPEMWSVAFVKDQWTRAVRQADGEVVRERKPERWGKGKRWLAVLAGSERA